jgi:hypothetical protein
LRNSTPYDILTDAFDRGDITDIADHYCEPGYSLPEGKKGVAFGNWNDKGYRLANILDRMGYEVEWLDEWTTCTHCYGAFRTQPDCYSWQMHGAFLELDCEMVCGDCLTANPDWLTEDVQNNPRKAITIHGFDHALEAAGWHMIPGDAWRNGWYGREDNPEEIVQSHVPRRHDYVFVIDYVSQFELAFRLWIRESAGECNTCGDTGEWETTTEESPDELVSLGPCPDC